jgi:hypothetical protein
MVTDASVCACRCRGGLLNSVKVRTVGRERRRGSLSDRILKPLHPSNSAGDGALRSLLTAAVRVSVERATVSPTREKCRPHPHMDRPPVSRVKRVHHTHAPSSLQNIRLSSAGANPLSRSHNQQADGDGCVGSYLDAGVVAAVGSRV